MMIMVTVTGSVYVVGGVLSACLFAVYVDGLVSHVKLCRFGCYIRSTGISILLYADDILLLPPPPSISALHLLLSVCVKRLDMSINVRKSTYLRIGARCSVKRDCITTLSGRRISWANNLRYLASHCSAANAKKSFYRLFPSIVF